MAAVQLQALVLVQRQLAAAPVAAADREGAAPVLLRLGLVCRAPTSPLIRARGVQLRLLYERSELAALRAQHAALERHAARLQYDVGRLQDNAAFEDEQFEENQRQRRELVEALGFDWYRQDHRAMIRFVEEMRSRPALSQAVPRDEQLVREREEIYVALGAHSDYDDHGAVICRLAQLRLRLPLTPFRLEGAQP